MKQTCSLKVHFKDNAYRSADHFCLARAMYQFLKKKFTYFN